MFGKTWRSYRELRRAAEGFTFVEVLAALLFMAIVIPVTVEGFRVASRAGVAGERKRTAAELAENALNELAATNGWMYAGQSGRFDPPWTEYEWRVVREPWALDALELVRIEVTYSVQDRVQSVRLSTLVGQTTP